MTTPHESVLLHEFLSFFEGMAINRFVDGTLGAGGHSEALLKAHPEIESLFGLDQDPSGIVSRSRAFEPLEI